MSWKSATPHPLEQIATSAPHKLLLKQWLKESELSDRRAALKESRIESLRREIAALYCSFFVLHSLLLLILLTIPSSSSTCRRLWVPILTSLSLSLSLMWAVRYKSDGEAHLHALLDRDREDSLLLSKCLDELKKKGLDFDLLKEVDALRRAKSLRLDLLPPKGGGGAHRLRRCSSARDFGLAFLFLSSCLVLWLNWFVLCGR